MMRRRIVEIMSCDQHKLGVIGAVSCETAIAGHHSIKGFPVLIGCTIS